MFSARPACCSQRPPSRRSLPPTASASASWLWATPCIVRLRSGSDLPPFDLTDKPRASVAFCLLKRKVHGGKEALRSPGAEPCRLRSTCRSKACFSPIKARKSLRSHEEGCPRAFNSCPPAIQGLPQQSWLGGVAEWSIASDSKSDEPQGSGGSNPFPSARLYFQEARGHEHASG